MIAHFAASFLDYGCGNVEDHTVGIIHLTILVPMTGIPVAVLNIIFQPEDQFPEVVADSSLWGCFLVFVGQDIVYPMVVEGEIMVGQGDFLRLRFLSRVP